MSEHKDIKEVIGNIFSSGGKLSRGYNAYTVEQVWRSTFGEVISNYTNKVNYHQGKLTVYITSAPLREELQMTKDKVVAKLNSKLQYKKVTELIIR